MKNFENLLLSFPELENSVKQSTKGGTDEYESGPENYDWWKHFDPNTGVISLPGITVTPNGSYTDYDVRNNDPYGYPYGNGSGNDSGGGYGGGSSGDESTHFSPTKYIASGTQASFMDIVGLMATSLGAAASHADIAASVMKLESAAAFSSVATKFGVFDIATNAIEFWDSPNWEDAGQIALGLTLTFGGLTGAGAVIGGAILIGWELYEYKRDH